MPNSSEGSKQDFPPLEKVTAFFENDPLLVVDAVRSFTEEERAELALICFRTNSLRNLSFMIGSTCSEPWQQKICRSLVGALAMRYGKAPRPRPARH